MSKHREIDLKSVKTMSIEDRQSKVDDRMLAQPYAPRSSMKDFLEWLPDVLAVKDLRALAGHIMEAKARNKPILLMMGAHVIKVGLSPLIIDLMRRGLIQGTAMNGAGVIHDVELGYFGQTSEDVSFSLKDGSFGMVKETADVVNGTVANAVSQEQLFLNKQQQTSILTSVVPS